MIQAQIPTPIIAEDGAFSVSMLQHFVHDGGWITWFVLIPLSVVMLSLIFHYAVVIRRSAHVPSALGRVLLSTARQGQFRQVVEIARENPTMLGQAAYAGVAQLRAGRDSARVAVEEVVDERATKLLRRIEYLHVIGNVSPMIGLFGTVLGMIMAFSRIAEAGGGMPAPGQLAGDISVALVTTFWGILIAIPSLTMHAVFRNKVDAFAAECVKHCEDLLSAISQQVSRGSSRGNSGKSSAAKNAADAAASREDATFSASLNDD
jgi:biopolymer transport protein ExbB